MAAKIIILEQISVDPLGFRYALWAAVPLVRQPFFANAAAKSAWVNAAAADLAALQAGQIVEVVRSQQWAAATSIATIQAALIAEFNAFQTQVTGTGGNNWARYGTTWDGTTWTAGGVA
jgi:hypothetical protein